MLAQVYTDGGEDFIRIFEGHLLKIFEGHPLKKIADLPKPDEKISVTEDADVALHRLHLYRNQKWQKMDWGFEARVYFRV